MIPNGTIIGANTYLPSMINPLMMAGHKNISHVQRLLQYYLVGLQTMPKPG
jgi:hypothetical protein